MSAKRNSKRYKAAKPQIIKEFGGDEKNTGSAEVQVGLLSFRINQIASHLTDHKQDKSARRSLLRLVGKRRRLLKFIEKTEGAEVLTRIRRDVGLE